MAKAGVYVRVSLDREGVSESPERQRRDCEELARTKGFEVVDVYEDRDVSAYSKGARRPAYERMLRDLRDGTIDTVVFWKLDRLTRQGLTGLTPLVELGAQLVSVHESIDTTSPMGEGVAGLLASVAKQESANISLRVKRAHRSAAEKGRAHSGGSRHFGYTPDGEVVRDEAAVVDEVARRVLDGESLRSIAADLNARGVRTTTGGAWHANVLGRMVRSPRLAGFRTHNGETYEGTWPKILDEETHHRLVETRSAPRAYRQPRHLLAGIIYCGVCGGKLKTMGMRLQNGRPFERYQCVKTPGRVNCGKVAVTKRSTDEDVRGRLFDVLSSGQLLPGRDGSEPDEKQLRRLLDDDRRALKELVRAKFVDRVIGQDEYLPAKAALDERVRKTESELAAAQDQRRRADRAPGLRPGSVEDLEAWWRRADERERREAVHAAVREVTVLPAKRRGGNRYDPARVQVSWDWKLLARIAEKAAEGMTDEDRERAEAEYRELARREADEDG